MSRNGNRPGHHEYIIVGAGPAGLQMAYCFEKSGRDYVILEGGDSAGSFFKNFPRHRKLISINKVSTGFSDPELNMRWDWNSLLDSGEVLFKNHSKSYFPPADSMVEYLNEFAAHHRLKISYNTRVTRVSKAPEHFVLTTATGESYTCDRLIFGTGVSLPRIPSFPGVELCESYVDVSLDPEDFRDQRVMIVGKGNSGFETADNLVETTTAIHMASPTPVRLAWKTHFVGHLRAINNNLLDTYQLKSQNTILDCEIVSVRKIDDGRLMARIAYTHASGQWLDIPVHRVILCTGFRFDASIFDETCRPELVIHDKLPASTSEWECANVPDLYFIGTLMQARDYQKAFSGFIHGFRYNVRALAQVLDCKYHGEVWPSERLEADAEMVLEALMDRAHSNSSLFQQPEFFSDVIAAPGGGDALRYYRDMPVDYLRDGRLGDFPHYYTLTMEYGHEDHPDPFNIVRLPDRGDMSAFIHPVIRRFSGDELMAEYHVPEDLENNWRQDMYLQPLLEFLKRDLVAVADGLSGTAPLGQLAGQAG